VFDAVRAEHFDELSINCTLAQRAEPKRPSTSAHLIQVGPTLRANGLHPRLKSGLLSPGLVSE